MSGTDKLGRPDRRGIRAMLGPRGTREQRAQLARQALKETEGLKARPALLELQGLRGLQDRPDPKVSRAFLGRSERRVRLDLRG